MDEITQEQAEQNNQPSYWMSVGISGVIFGILVFVLSLVSGYAVINSEPTGSFFSPVQFIGVLVCLVGTFGGMLAIWHYANEFEVDLTLGRGALIGFLTGACIAIISVLLNQVWATIDPDMTQKIIDSTVANMEAMDLPDAQRQQAIDSSVETIRGQQNIGSQLLWNIPMYGMLNLITGIIGVKLFGKQED